MLKALVPALLAACILVTGWAPWTLLSGQDPPQEEERTQEEDAHEKALAALRTRLDALEKTVKLQATQIETQTKGHKDSEARLQALETWFRGLPITTAALQKGISDVERLGFTYAGANTQAREELLATLRTLAQNLSAPVPKLPPPASSGR